MKVIAVKGLEEEMGIDGLYLHKPVYTIYLESSLDSLKKGYVLFHELVHFFFFTLKIPESFHEILDALTIFLELII